MFNTDVGAAEALRPMTHGGSAAASKTTLGTGALDTK